MAFLLFLAALLGIVLFAVIVNRVTGTRASYLETLQLEASEQELWRDTEADFATVPKLGRAVVMSFPRLGRHAVVWTDRRIIVSQKVLFSAKRMITHQIVFVNGSGSPSAGAHAASREFFGGFYGRGFETVLAANRSFGRVNEKDCIRIEPTAESGSTLNIDQILIFTDRLSELLALRLETLAGADHDRQE
jgi:hypothetical protein